MDAPAWDRRPEALRADPDAAVAQPVLDALSPWGRGAFYRVDIVVPIFEGLGDDVLQILHPFEHQQVPVTWTEAAARSGVPRSELWSPDPAAPNDVAAPATKLFSTPNTGVLHPDYRRVLVEHLAPFTGSEDVHFLVWRGYGVDWPGAAEIELENRPCVLLAGPLSDYADEGWFDNEPAKVCWPDDLSWAFASDTDLPATYVAGPDPLLAALHADPRIETGWLPRDAATTAVAD